MRAHLPALLACDGVDVVALVDPRTDVIEPAAARYRVPAIFRDVETMLGQVESLDAAVVATPTGAHRRRAPRARSAAPHR